jgi:hypothetical protein
MLAHQAEVETRNRRRVRAPVPWCPDATWKLRIEDYRVLYRVEADTVLVPSRTIQGLAHDRGDGIMSWHGQEEVDQITRDGIAEKLNELIGGYDGAPETAKEILRGLAAARMMDMDCRPFEDALAERHRSLDAA